MADDPLFGFKPVQQSAGADDPLMGFKPVQAAPPAGQDLGTTALWNKPANTSWNDYLMAHLAKPFQGADQAAQDYSRTAVDAATFGQGDRLQAYLTGNPLDKERAATAAASGRLGAMAPIVQGAMYAMGPGELGIAKGLGETAAPAIGKWAGGVLGSGVEGAGAGMIGTAGHDEDPNQGMLWGGALGALGGVPGGVVGRGGTLPTSPSAKSYFDQATKEFKPLSNILYDAKSEVHPAIDITDAKNALNDWSGYKWDKATGTKAEIDTLLEKPQLSANDLDQSRRALGKIQGNPNASDNDQIYAKYYKDRLQSVLDNGTPQTGVPQNWTPPPAPAMNPPAAGQGTMTINGQPFKYANGQWTQPSYASSVIAKGKFLTGQARDMERTDVWHDVGGTTAGRDIGTQSGSWSADQAARAAAGKPGVFASPGSPYFNATEALAQTTGKPTALDWGTKHFVLGPLAAIGLGEGVNAATGGEGTGHQPWWARMAEEAGTGLIYAGGKAGYSAYTAAANRAEQQAAEAALRQTIASRTMQNPLGTYNPLSSATAPSPLRDWVRQFIYSQGAAGRLPGQ